jgi:hypothetical protein
MALPVPMPTKERFTIRVGRSLRGQLGPKIGLDFSSRLFRFSGMVLLLQLDSNLIAKRLDLPPLPLAPADEIAEEKPLQDRNQRHRKNEENVSYSTWFNRLHRRVGPLFQGRFKAVLHDQDGSALTINRYVHLNPVRVTALGGHEGRVAAEQSQPNRWPSSITMAVSTPL